MPNLRNINRDKQASSYPKFKPEYGPSAGKSSDQPKEIKDYPHRTGTNEIGDINNEAEQLEDLANQGEGDENQTDDETENELGEGELSGGPEEHEIAILNAIETARQIADQAREKASELHKKAKYTAGDIICIALAGIKDLIEIVGTAALGLGVLIGPLISIFVTFVLFIVRMFKGMSVISNMTRSSLLWMGDLIVPVFPVYTIGMVMQIHKDVKDAKLEAEEQDNIVKQAELSMQELSKK